MKPIAFGIALAGVLIGYGIAGARKELNSGQNTTATILILATFFGIVLS